MKTIDLLVTLDENYLPQLRVMLASLLLNNPGIRFRVYFLHRDIPEQKLASLDAALRARGHELVSIRVDEELFRDAPVTRYYAQEMYYRLLAAQLLPESLEKVLYLDPDILVINSVEPLWETPLGDALFAAAAHTGKAELAEPVNQLRLGTDHAYYNSGVLLINLAQCRREVHPEDIFAYVEAHAAGLLLPDQDVLNALYGSRILPLDDLLWNYDARNYATYLVSSHGEAEIDWVLQHTAILHFCGKSKPWKPLYRHRFGILYKHYRQLTDRVLLPETAE